MQNNIKKGKIGSWLNSESERRTTTRINLGYKQEWRINEVYEAIRDLETTITRDHEFTTLPVAPRKIHEKIKERRASAVRNGSETYPISFRTMYNCIKKLDTRRKIIRINRGNYMSDANEQLTNIISSIVRTRYLDTFPFWESIKFQYWIEQILEMYPQLRSIDSDILVEITRNWFNQHFNMFVSTPIPMYLDSFSGEHIPNSILRILHSISQRVNEPVPMMSESRVQLLVDFDPLPIKQDIPEDMWKSIQLKSGKKITFDEYKKIETIMNEGIENLFYKKGKMKS